MSEFLAPLNYDRARDVLRRLSVYTTYRQDGAREALAVLKQSYPLIFSKMELKTFANEAILLEMGGASVTDPLVFTSHLDAPSSTASIAAAVHELPMCVPLSRAHIVALLEALEELLRDGYLPGGDLFLAISMDGLSGGEGAKSLAAHLQVRGLTPCFILDHGGYVTMDAFRTYLPDSAPLALVGIVEKGILLGEVTADEAVAARHENRRPLPELLRYGAKLAQRPRRPALCSASAQMLRALGARAPFLQKQLVGHPRLNFPLLTFLWRKRAILHQFFLSELNVYDVKGEGTSDSPAKNATLRFSLTVIPGKKNSVWRKQVKRKLNNDDLKLTFTLDSEGGTRSDPSGEAWDALETAVEIQFDRVTIVPCLSPRVTDARFYTELCDKVYRFSPFMVTGIESLHGECTVTDGALQIAVQFFRSMLSV